MANSAGMVRLTWTVVFREGNNSPQEEFVRYTQEAADAFANLVQTNGGVAIVVEGSEEVPGNDPDNFVNTSRNRGHIEW